MKHGKYSDHVETLSSVNKPRKHLGPVLFGGFYNCNDYCGRECNE